MKKLLLASIITLMSFSAFGINVITRNVDGQMACYASQDVVKIVLTDEGGAMVFLNDDHTVEISSNDFKEIAFSETYSTPRFSTGG